MFHTSIFVSLHFCLLLRLLPHVIAAQNFVVPWSTTKFGPDGPWQAVRITVGGNDSALIIGIQNVTELSVYPGGSWSSMTFAESACSNYSNTMCGLGGTWDPDPNQVIQQPVTGSQPFWVDKSSGIDVKGAKEVILGLTINGKTVWNATLASASSGNITYPNGMVGGVTLGYLSLGAPRTKQFFSTSDTEVGHGYNASLFAGQLFDDKEIPSYSYGLHIGSAAFNYSGSLVFGGYNKGRVIGPVTSFPGQDTVDLVDISIGVEYGGSPFNFTSKDKLLSTGQTAVSLNPLSPYISLPRKTCDALAALLPVTFDQSLKYYVWNTEDPLFAKIVSSPAYIGFTFPPSPGDRDNVVIKLPFALLNLTLEKPITNTPKQYFPCMPYEGSPTLGRAFLQTAFIGTNWGRNLSWLAQAPGPGVARQGLGVQNTDLPEQATTIDGFTGQNLFNESWKGHWSIIDSQSISGPQPSVVGDPPVGGQSKGGLSKGAKAGIGVGTSVAVIVIVGILFFMWRKRSVYSKVLASPEQVSGHPTANEYFKKHSPYPTQDQSPKDSNGLSTDVFELPELPGIQAGSPVEIPDSSPSTQH